MHLTNCLLRRVDVAHESPVGAIGAATWTAGKLVFLAVAVAMCGQNVLAQTDVPFRVHLLNADSEFSAATAFDISGDGRTDIVCGAYWYEAPTWTRHHFREVEQIRGRFNDYSNLALDVDQDGDLDLVSANYRSKSLYWCRNPGLATDAAAPTAGLVFCPNFARITADISRTGWQTDRCGK